MKFVLFCLLMPLAWSQDRSCDRLEAEAEAQVTSIREAKDSLGGFETLAALALAGTRVCPQSARLWYLASRAGEVMKDATGSDVFVGSGGLQKVLGEARARAPRSAAVVTVAARLEGSTALARLALELDPAYQPARCALAELLARDGAIPEALRIAVVSHPSSQREVRHLTRARVLLAAKRPTEALAETKLAMREAIKESDELTPGFEFQRDQQEVLGFVQLAMKNTMEAEKALHVAAGLGSLPAQRYFAHRRSAAETGKSK